MVFYRLEKKVINTDSKVASPETNTKKRNNHTPQKNIKTQK